LIFTQSAGGPTSTTIVSNLSKKEQFEIFQKKIK
jgi:hypothetical protein